MPYKSQKQYRYKEYDYSQDGFYFVTICCKNREMFFGDIKNGKMQLSEIGKIAEKFWLEIPDHFIFMKLDKFVIMPNHIHGIIEIDNCRNNCRNAPRRVPVNNASSVGMNASVEKNAPRRVPTGIQPLVNNSLSSVINHFKGNIKRFCNKNNLEYFAWEARFHDRIIRNNNELNRIRQYIINNPEKNACPPLAGESDRNLPALPVRQAGGKAGDSENLCM